MRYTNPRLYFTLLYTIWAQPHRILSLTPAGGLLSPLYPHVFYRPTALYDTHRHHHHHQPQKTLRHPTRIPDTADTNEYRAECRPSQIQSDIPHSIQSHHVGARDSTAGFRQRLEYALLSNTSRQRRVASFITRHSQHTP